MVGRVMRTLTVSAIVAAGVLSASILPANAQDARPALWQGFYAGGQIGYGNGLDKSNGANGPVLQNDLDGGFAGAQLGYNIRSGDWVFGPEISAAKTWIKGSTSCPNAAFTCNTDAKSLAHANARLGYVTGSALIYGTAGFSTGKLNDTGVYIGANPAFAGLKFSGGERHNGWNAGFGVEYDLTAAWSAGIEYRHVSLGEKTQVDQSNLNAQTNAVTHSQRAELVSARLNYHFGR
jgi:outer membrane immunogenic protein